MIAIKPRNRLATILDPNRATRGFDEPQPDRVDLSRVARRAETVAEDERRREDTAREARVRFQLD